MSKNLYELIALAARYVFTLLMLLIVIRAWRITLIDSRRAAKLRRWAPETGVIGEMQVLEGDERARKGMVYPVIREGLIGRSRKADIRLCSHSVRLRHTYFEITEDGLMLRAAGSAHMRGDGGRTRHMYLHDGDQLQVGKIRLLLVLNDASGVSAVPAQPTQPVDDIFDVPAPSAPPAEDITATSGTLLGEFTAAQNDDDYDRLLNEERQADAAAADAAADAAIYGEAPAQEKEAPKKNQDEEWWPHG